MSVIAKRFTLGSGSKLIQSPSLFGVTILGVWREGYNFKEISAVTAFTESIEWKRVVKFGSILFSQAANPGGERVWVIYKT